MKRRTCAAAWRTTRFPLQTLRTGGAGSTRQSAREGGQRNRRSFEWTVRKVTGAPAKESGKVCNRLTVLRPQYYPYPFKVSRCSGKDETCLSRENRKGG